MMKVSALLQFLLLLSLCAVGRVASISQSDICDSTECHVASKYLGLETISGSTVSPCHDFGRFMRSAWNQSQPIPVIGNVFNTVFMRLVNIFNAENGVGDSRMTKVAKKFYKKCLIEGEIFILWNSDDLQIIFFNSTKPFRNIARNRRIFEYSRWFAFSQRKLLVIGRFRV